MKSRNYHHSGFTLIEVIVTIVIFAVFSAMMIPYFSSALIKSGEPVRNLQYSADLHRTMENITAAFNQYPKWRTGVAYSTGDKVIPTIRNGNYYTCSGGTSTTEPKWPLTGSVSHDGITWTAGALNTLATLKANIGTEGSNVNATYNDSGRAIKIVKNEYIQFSNGMEAAGGTNVLKVTLQNAQGERLTGLFVSN